MSAVSPEDVNVAVAALRQGALVVYPTETVYGLGAAALHPVCLARLLALKQRPDEKGVSVLIENLEAASDLFLGPPPGEVKALAQAFWPGPLTIVLPATRGLPWPLVGTTGGVGLRCSSDATAMALVERFGDPLTATSANPSGEPPAGDASAARVYFGDGVASYLDGGPRKPDSASTVVEFLGNRVILRRAGVITKQRLGTIVTLHASE